MNSHNIDLLKGRKILVVEDTESNFTLMRLVLESVGATIDRAKNGEQALQKISDDLSYDVIIMDVKLPGMNGYMVTRKIREKNIKIPVIANTAFALKGENEKAIESGCDAYISKPTDKDLLVRMVNSLIQK